MIDRNALLAAAQFVPEFMNFPTAWCGHLPFAAWLIATRQPSCLVELGTHTGNSYLGFCQAVRDSDAPTRCYAVDTWQGDEHAGYYGEEIYQQLFKNHNQRYNKFSQLIRSTFDAALDQFTPGSVEVLHIDGMHTYDAVRHDFESWLPKLALGGVVLLHDTMVHERGFGVWKFWQELCESYPAHLEFKHSNGLGIVQIGVSKDDALPWLRPGSDEQKIVCEYFQSLGESMLERYRAREQAERIHYLEGQIAEHCAWEIKQGQAIIEKDAALVQLRDNVSELSEMYRAATVDRDFAISMISAMRSSSSWRITAPLRLIGYLVRGNFDPVRPLFAHLIDRIKVRLHNITGILSQSSANFPAISALVEERCKVTGVPIAVDPLCPPMSADWPAIDISVVTYNSEPWVAGFFSSLLALNYPRDKINVCFVDNSSTDETQAAIHVAIERLNAAGISSKMMVLPNRGYGAGHNAAIKTGVSPFCLVSNVDLTFEPDSLSYAVSMAMVDKPQAAAWEFRQKPYEHPKFYDPITGITNWNAHACVLLKRASFELIQGYDETLFMYGEDVELSYRLRRAGYCLRYCPKAVVWHYSYQSSKEVKPIQYTGSTFGNLYLRLKYGRMLDIAAVPLLALRLLMSPEAFPGSRWQVTKNLLRLITLMPKVLISRKKSTAHFPFRNWDYELIRDGAFVEQHAPPKERPLVSIITRTYKGRDIYLKQALLSTAHQTWENIERIVVEDGGDSSRALCEEIARSTGRGIRFIPNKKEGRSKAGNIGLLAAQGRWCLFLDDDDLLFADHVETLVNALIQDPTAVASYSLSWEVVTNSTDLGLGSYTEVEHRVPAVLRQSFDYKVLQHHNYFPIQSVLFERRLFEELGGFYEDMESLEDWTLWLCYARNNNFVHVPKVTSLYRTPAEKEKIQERKRSFDKAYPLALARGQGPLCQNTSNEDLRL